MSEEFNEHIERLEQALATEREQRQTSEAALAGLRLIATAKDLDATDRALCEGLRPLLAYERAVMLRTDPEDPDLLGPRDAEDPQLRAFRWPPGRLRARVAKGQTVALYDLRKVPELAPRLDASAFRSMLCMPLSLPNRPAILIGLHSQPGFFGSHYVALARSFAATAVRMLESLDARARDQQRLLAEEHARSLARTNEALREQLETIQSQRQEIQRLRAPVLLVAERTLVIPLIGALDPGDLAEVTESLLDALVAHRARTVILDLTGFESHDAGVTARLGALARTTAMLGGRCVLSGLRPAVALALSGAGVDMPAYASLAAALVAQRA